MPAQPLQALVPYLTVSPAAQAIDFYKRAFGLEEVARLMTPDGKVMHAQMRLGGADLYLADQFDMPGADTCQTPAALGGTTTTIHLNTPDVDAAFARATGAGATPAMPPADMFWGDRYATVIDPFGHHWSMTSPKEAVPPDEMQRRVAAMFASGSQQA